MLKSAQEGILVRSGGIDAVQNSDKVNKFIIIGKEGRYYCEETDDSARFGYVICKSGSTEEPQACCMKAIKKLNFTIK